MTKKGELPTSALAIAGLTCILSATVRYLSVVPAEKTLMNFSAYSVLLALYWALVRADEFLIPAIANA